MVGFPSVSNVSSLHFITLLNTLASVVENHVLPMGNSDLGLNTLASRASGSERKKTVQNSSIVDENDFSCFFRIP